MWRSPDLAIVAEDLLGVAIAQRLVEHIAPGTPLAPPPLHTHGLSPLLAGLPKYIGASRIVRHFLLVDLDRVACAPSLLQGIGLNNSPEGLMCRVAVREAEAWVLADREGFAAMAGIPVAKVPLRPEELPDPKQTLINLVRRSRRRRLAEQIVPPSGSRVSIGPLYNEVLGDHVRMNWDPDAAARVAPNLAKAVLRLGSFL